MSTGYPCSQCGEWLVFSHWLKKRWSVPTGDHCTRCGATHSVKKGVASAIGCQTLPFEFGVNYPRTSPWKSGRLRPAIVGYYECRFSDAGDMTLWWDGRYWRPDCDDRRAIITTTLVSWRGAWSTTEDDE